MSKKKGRMTYVPAITIMELEDICREDNIVKKADAFKELTKYARVGRETKRLITLDFSRAVKLPSISDIMGSNKRRKK